MEFREMSATGEFGFRRHTRRKGEISHGARQGCAEVGENEPRSGKMAQNQAARTADQSRRIPRPSRVIRTIARFGFRTNTRCKGATIRGRGRNAGKSAKTRRNWGEWPMILAARTRFRSHMARVEFRDIPASGGFGFRTHPWRQGEITPGRVRNVRKSAKTIRTWVKWALNQAARIQGRSRRIFRKSREIWAIAGFGIRTHTRCMGEII